LAKCHFLVSNRQITWDHFSLPPALPSTYYKLSTLHFCFFFRRAVINESFSITNSIKISLVAVCVNLMNNWQMVIGRWECALCKRWIKSSLFWCKWLFPYLIMAAAA
jgi:hypothetical protein